MTKNQSKGPEAVARPESAEYQDNSIVYIGKNVPRLGLKTYTVYTEYIAIPEHIRAELEKSPIYKALFVHVSIMRHAVADLHDKTSALYQINSSFEQ